MQILGELHRARKGHDDYTVRVCVWAKKGDLIGSLYLFWIALLCRQLQNFAIHTLEDSFLIVQNVLFHLSIPNCNIDLILP